MLEGARAFAVLSASDLARAERWYAEKLGLEPIVRADQVGLVAYRLGGTQIAIYQTPNAGTARSTVLGIVVPDLEATMRELRDRGVVFNDYDLPDGPQTVDGVASDGTGGMAAWFTDSEGNIVNVVQLPPGFPEL